MDKTNGCVQILEGCLFYSLNCSRTVVHPPLIRDVGGGKPNPFLPSHQPNGCCNYFELDITKYASPCWWTLAFGYISFFPLMPSLCGPIFEKLFMPRSHHHVFDEESGNPINTFCFGYSKGHTRSGVLHMALHRGRDWFIVWMALLLYVIAEAEAIHSSVKDSAVLAKPSW